VVFCLLKPPLAKPQLPRMVKANPQTNVTPSWLHTSGNKPSDSCNYLTTIRSVLTRSLVAILLTRVVLLCPLINLITTLQGQMEVLLKSDKLVTALPGISPAPSGVQCAPPVVPSVPSVVWEWKILLRTKLAKSRKTSLGW